MVKLIWQKLAIPYILQAKEIIGFSGMLSSHNLGVWLSSLALAEVLGIKISHVDILGHRRRARFHEEISPAMLLAVTKVTEQIQARLFKIK